MTTITKIEIPSEMKSLSARQILVNLGYEWSEQKDRKGHKTSVFTKNGIDYKCYSVPVNATHIELGVI